MVTLAFTFGMRSVQVQEKRSNFEKKNLLKPCLYFSSVGSGFQEFICFVANLLEIQKTLFQKSEVITLT